MVDDQPDVRELIGCTLSEWGYQVRTAAGGRDALRLAETEAGPFDLVLSDVVMPEMGGAELAARLNAIRSPPRTVRAYHSATGLDGIFNRHRFAYP